MDVLQREFEKQGGSTEGKALIPVVGRVAGGVARRMPRGSERTERCTDVKKFSRTKMDGY